MDARDFAQLGAAEKYAAQTFIGLITRAVDASENLVAGFANININEDNIERVLLNSSSKNIILDTLPTLERLVDNLEKSFMLPMILEIVVKNREVN